MPGITGWSQVNGRNAIDWTTKLALDTWYVDHWSLALDARILACTVLHVLRRDGISREGHATTPKFQGDHQYAHGMRLVLLLLVAFTGIARAQTLTERATATIESQRALLDKGRPGILTLLKGMDPDGMVVGAMSVESPKKLLELLAAKAFNDMDTWARNSLHALFWVAHESHTDDKLAPPTRSTVRSTVSNVVAGGRADAVWFSFDLVVDRATTSGKPFKMTDAFRITELLVDKGGWKVALFHIDKAKPDEWDELPSLGGGPPTGEHFPDGEKDSTFSDLATTPTKLAKALLVEPSTIVLGSSAGDRGVGAGATKLVRGWSKLKLTEGTSLQRTSKTWGFAVVRLDLDGKNEDQKMRMFASVIALPKADGRWQVVTLHYSRINSM